MKKNVHEMQTKHGGGSVMVWKHEVKSVQTLNKLNESFIQRCSWKQEVSE